jgi:3-isopropylmalate dehydrogenase
MMLSWLGDRRGLEKLTRAGAAIETAVDAVLVVPENRTRDLGGTVNTDAFGKLVAAALV